MTRDAIRRNRCCLFAFILLLAGIPSPRSAAASCANFLAIDGVFYSRTHWNNEEIQGRPHTADDLGDVYRTVAENSMSLNRKAKRQARKAARENEATPSPDVPPSGSTAGNCGTDDNFSTDLPLGTPLHVVAGYDPTFRLGARLDDGSVVLFEVYHDPTAQSGGDLLDITGRVVTIRLTTREEVTLATIEDGEIVTRLVNLMTQAPIADPHLPPEVSPLTIFYDLDDGTVTRDHWYPDTGDLVSGIQAPAAFSDLLRAALAGQGTPAAG